jgi:CRISPR-associated helicase cas3 family protein
MEALRELVDEGEWEAVIARTDRRWGPWGTAYLEALLRAADCSISSEGK